MNKAISELTAQIQSLLENPRYIFAYGMDLRELRHNAFLHFMLGPTVPVKFSNCLVVEILSAIKQSTSGHQQPVPALQSSDNFAITKCDYNVGQRGKRPDEVIELKLPSSNLAIVIEMKMKAAHGESQLDNYVQDKRIKFDGDVVGLLLRIPGRDELGTETYPRINGKEYSRCIEAAMRETPSGEWNEDAKWLVEDYIATLNFLDEIDSIIVNSGNALLEISKTHDCPGSVKEWIGANWRWICLRIARQVAIQIDGFLPEWKGGAYGTTGNAAVDIHYEGDGFGLSKNEFGASIYFHWHVGKGFEVRAIVDDYHGARAKESRQLMLKLASATEKTLRNIWNNRKAVYFKSAKFSCMIGRISNPTLDANEITQHLKTEVQNLIVPLQKTVSTLLEAEN